MAAFFSGKTVIVTGSSNGIGREVAHRLAEQGARVTITGTKADTLAVTKKECLAAGAKESDVFDVLGDIALEDTAKKIVDGTVAKFGGLDVLINNAGAYIPDPEGRAGIEQPIEYFDRNIAVNVRSVILISQLAIPHLERTKGAIVNVSSVGGQPFCLGGYATYYATAKAAVDQITVQMAGTLILKGIRVNSVSPGIIETNFAHNAGMGSEEQCKERYDRRGANRDIIPVGRSGRPDDIAKLILFLADRSQSEFIIGQRYTADGGTVLKLTLGMSNQ